jgi:hypothetical protein
MTLYSIDAYFLMRQDLHDNRDIFLPFLPPAHRADAPEGRKAKTKKSK